MKAAAGKDFGGARDRAGIFRRRLPASARERRPYPVSPSAKPRELKDNSAGGRKLKSRKTVWWGWQGQCSEASCHSSGCKSRRHRSPVDVVVIPSGGEGDQPVGSLEVKVPGGWGVIPVRSVQGGKQSGRP